MFRRITIGFALILFVSSLLAAQAKVADYRLSIIHVNDTHSRFEPSLTKLTMDIDDSLKAKPVYLELGGFPYVADIIARLRSTEPNPLVLHAGDFFQGSLYFTKYLGNADVAFWNLVRLDAATLGNHEFDKGSQVLYDALLSQAKFPLVDANVDMSKDPVLKPGAPAPYTVLTIGKAKIGVIGVTTTETPYISSPSKQVAFNDPLASVQKAADSLTKAGVNKIIVISHLGYDQDRAIASKLDGVDVIVGGHSHSLLGNWKPVGLGSGGEYPTALKDKSGNQVLVVQAWEWAKVVGDLGVDFDARGHIIAWESKSKLVANSSFVQAYDLPDANGAASRVRWQWTGYALNISLNDGKEWKPAPAESQKYWTEIYAKLGTALAKRPEIAFSAGDPKAWSLAREYALGVVDLQRTVVAQVGEDLKRGLNAGPGPIVADSMRAYAKTQVAISNAGGIRTDLLAGPLTTAKVYELIPFGNTLVTCQVTGDQLRRILEDAVDFALPKYGNQFPANPLVYVSGIQFSVHPSQTKGSRISDLSVAAVDGAISPIDPNQSYSLVVNNFNAAGGDKFDTLAAITGKTDTGFIDAEALLAYVAGKTLSKGEERIKVEQ